MEQLFAVGFPLLSVATCAAITGRLSTHSSAGQTSKGQLDGRFALNANSSGPNCSCNVTWTAAR